MSSDQVGWKASRSNGLHGSLELPGDKSISHRAIILASIADGVSEITGFLEGDDTQATAAIFQQMGVQISQPSPGTRIVKGVGLHGLHPSARPLDCKNSGTAMRLLSGLLSGKPFLSTLVGDASLSQRPMRRVTEPLIAMGANIDTTDKGTAPLCIHGACSPLVAIDYRCEIASAQVKSAILLAGLYAKGVTKVTEPRPTRDYTERMLSAFGVSIDFAPGYAQLQGFQRLTATNVIIPGDFSSAAFFIVAATIIPGSEIILRSIGIHPRRIGLVHALRLMGAQISLHGQRTHDGEEIADIHIRYAPLHGTRIPENLVPDMIDEFPALCVAAATAQGRTVISGAAELRVKECDRLAAMANGLRVLGIHVEESSDGAVITGGSVQSGDVVSCGDHRIAMAFSVAGQIAQGMITISDIANVATSFPGYAHCAQKVGFALEEINQNSRVTASDSQR